VQLGRHSRLSSKRYPWCLLLFQLVRKLRPASCLELGTCAGISASYQAAALELNGSGKLLTLEGAPDLARIATDHFAALGLSQRASVTAGAFRDTLPRALAECGPVDLVFVDGHHDEHATWEYYRQVLPCAGQGSVIVFDDIDWSPGMERVWQRIREDPELTAAIDMIRLGVCLVGRPANGAAVPLQFRAAV
jgi:predicted O-methyltransferase YrrM